MNFLFRIKILVSGAFSQHMEYGESRYNLGDYIGAKQEFEQALHINRRDFRANFWQARTLATLGDTIEANKYLFFCQRLHPKIAEGLISPWEEFCNSVNSLQNDMMEGVIELNKNTDKRMEADSRQPEWKIGKAIKFLIQWTIVSALVGAIAAGAVGIIGTMVGYSQVILVKVATASIPFIGLPILLWLFYRRIPISLPLKSNCKRLIAETHTLLTTKSFLKYLTAFISFIIICVMLAFVSPHTKTMIKNSFNYKIFTSISWVVTIILAPIIEEIIFRGILYNCLIKYSKWLAYLSTSLLFALTHEEWIVVIFIKSLVFTWFYDKYKMIQASIIVHSVNNLIATVALSLLIP